jgi:hypothetical protein
MTAAAEPSALETLPAGFRIEQVPGRFWAVAAG